MSEDHLFQYLVIPPDARQGRFPRTRLNPTAHMANAPKTAVGGRRTGLLNAPLDALLEGDRRVVVFKDNDVPDAMGISSGNGRDVWGSCVAFENGRPRKFHRRRNWRSLGNHVSASRGSGGGG